MNGRPNGRGGDDVAEITRQMRGTLAIVRGRMQLMQRRQERGGPSGHPTANDFVVVDAAIGRLVALIERIEG
jgi:hypothetical protein